MTTTRSYRGARSVDEAIVELDRCAGTQFDPAMVEALIAAVKEQGWERETGQEPVADPSVYAEPRFGSDEDDPTSSAEKLAASEAPVRAEAQTVADTAAEVNEALSDLWGMEYRVGRADLAETDDDGSAS